MVKYTGDEVHSICIYLNQSLPYKSQTFSYVLEDMDHIWLKYTTVVNVRNLANWLIPITGLHSSGSFNVP